MSFSLAAIRSVNYNQSLRRKKLRGIKHAGLPIARTTKKIIEPASAIVIKQFQQKLAKERRQDKLILAVILSITLLISISAVLMVLEII